MPDACSTTARTHAPCICLFTPLPPLQAEYQAEQERLDTLAMLSPAEAERQRQRASISFM